MKTETPRTYQGYAIVKHQNGQSEDVDLIIGMGTQTLEQCAQRAQAAADGRTADAQETIIRFGDPDGRYAGITHSIRYCKADVA